MSLESEVVDAIHKLLVRDVKRDYQNPPNLRPELLDATILEQLFNNFFVMKCVLYGDMPYEATLAPEYNETIRKVCSKYDESMVLTSSMKYVRDLVKNDKS